MTFTQIDDALMDSPAMLNVTRSARLLLMEGYSYCNRQLTDGAITETQWRRATDTDDFLEELEALERVKLITRTASGWQLDWSQQQTREQVERGRERRRVDNERRAKSLELHKSGDHSLCTHEGGGRARGALQVAASPADKPGSRGPSRGRGNGPSSGSSTSASTGPSSGHAPRTRKTASGPSDGPSTDTSTETSTGRSTGRPLVGSPSPAHPSPAQPVVERRVGGWGGGPGDVSALASAGATAAASTGLRTRTMPGGFVVSADMLGGVDPNSLTQDEIENVLCDQALAE